MEEMKHSYDISQDIDDHIGDVDSIIGKWERASGMVKPEEAKSVFLLKTLPECWGVMVSTWESRALPYEELQRVVGKYPISIGCGIMHLKLGTKIACTNYVSHAQTMFVQACPNIVCACKT